MNSSLHSCAGKIWCFWLFIALLCVAYQLSGVSKKAMAQYEEIIRERGAFLRKPMYDEELAIQKRSNVCKKLWFSDKGTRLSSEIYAKESELKFLLKKEGLHIIEELHDVRAKTQQELFYMLPDGKEIVKNDSGAWCIKSKDASLGAGIVALPPGTVPMQKFRYFEAKLAHYNYETEDFSAQDVKMWQYCTQGHQLVECLDSIRPIGQGKAAKLCMHFIKDKFEYKADQLKMKFFVEGDER